MAAWRNPHKRRLLGLLHWLDCLFRCSSLRVTTDQAWQFEFSFLGYSTWGFSLSAWGTPATTLRPTEWWSASTDNSKQPSCVTQTQSDSRPAILAMDLAFCATFKPSIQAAPTELVYGEPLYLPGKFLAALPSNTKASDPTNFVARLRRTVAVLRLSLAAHHTKPVPFAFKKLATCTHAFPPDDTIRRPFQPPYYGPDMVVCCDDKNYT